MLNKSDKILGDLTIDRKQKNWEKTWKINLFSLAEKNVICELAYNYRIRPCLTTHDYALAARGTCYESITIEQNIVTE